MNKLNIDTIIELIKSSDKKATIQGVSVKVCGVRLKTFAYKGTDCICCGVKGFAFMVDINGQGPHLNLYAKDSNNNLVLMTRDHIVCRSHGGPNTVDNMSPMCVKCNGLRGTMPQDDFLKNFQDGVPQKSLKPYDALSKVRHLDKHVNKSGGSMTILIDKHIKAFGFDSHLNKAWINSIGKLHVRGTLHSICEDIGDDLGMEIIQYFGCSGKRRGKLRTYIKQFHRADYCTSVYEKYGQVFI